MDQYDKTNQTGIGAEGVVDPHERAEFLKKDIGVDPAGFLNLLEDPKNDRASFLKPTFDGWKSKIIIYYPFLSDLQFEQFKEALLGVKSVNTGEASSNAVVMNIGDDKASGQFNSQATVTAARLRDIPRKGRAFISLDPSKEVTFTIDLDSVNAFNRPKKEEGDSSMLSFSRVYIVPKDYKGKVPPLPEETAKWHEKAKGAGFSGPVEEYFYEIVPGQTESKSSKIFDNGRGDFSFTVKMPPGSYEVHGVSGEFKQANNQSDFDNFIIKVTGHNAVAQTEVLYVPIATTFEVEDAMQRRFIEQVTKTAEDQTGDGSVKGKRIDIIFAIDNSESMRSAAELVRNTVKNIILALKRGGADAIRVGVITFNNWGSIDTELPLCEMTEGNLAMLYNVVNHMWFSGGMEPVGKATLEAISQLKCSDESSCQVMVLTDDDGLADDEGFFYSDEVVRAAANAKVAVTLQKMKGQKTSMPSTEEVVPAEYIALLKGPPDSKDEARLARTRELAFGNSRKDAYKVAAQKGLLVAGSKEDIDSISEKPQNFDSSMLQLLIGRGAMAKDALYKVARGTLIATDSSEAAKALLALEGEEAVKKLKDILLDEKASLSNRKQIANLLVSRSDDSAIQFLANLAKANPKTIDSETLRQLISKGAFSKEELAAVAMSDADPPARREAVKALIATDKELAANLAEAIFSSTSYDSETVEMMLSIDKERATAFLNNILQEKKYSHIYRLEIAKSLAVEGEDEAIDYICVEAAAVGHPKALFDFLAASGEKGLNAVRKMATDAYDCDRRLAAIETLISYDKETAIKAVRAILDNVEARESFNSYSVRNRVVSILLILDEKEAVKILKAQLKNEDPYLRFQAAALLLPYDQNAAKKELVSLAKMPEFAARVRVILSKPPKTQQKLKTD